MKKIVIIGATGNTGTYLTEYLLENLNLLEYQIIAVGRRKTDFFNKYGIKYYQIDISKKEEFEKLPQAEIYGVIFLAAVLPAYMEGYSPESYISTNIIGAFNVLEYCRKSKCDRIIYPQTESDLSEYWDKIFKISPNLPRNFKYKGDHALYTISKNTAVDMIEHYNQTYGIKNFILRCPSIYSYSKNPYYYVNGKKQVLGYRQIIDKAIKGEEIELWGDPNRAKDIVYVKDFCQMIFKMLITKKVNKGIYNMGTGKAISLQEQIEGIIEVFSPRNKKSKIKYCPEKPNSRNFVMDISNAIEELDYKPKYSYLDYLKDFKKEMELDRFQELRVE